MFTKAARHDLHQPLPSTGPLGPAAGAAALARVVASQVMPAHYSDQVVDAAGLSQVTGPIEGSGWLQGDCTRQDRTKAIRSNTPSSPPVHPFHPHPHERTNDQNRG
jgi:hypothetical protein